MELLCTKKWKNKKELRIYQIVDDVLNTDGNSLEEFTRNNLIDKDEINER
ncbi:MAG: hypothetical protein E7161_03110 [Firmicutes bacterium]|nr:hypothetical protein [Bacillota bacterium]